MKIILKLQHSGRMAFSTRALSLNGLLNRGGGSSSEVSFGHDRGVVLRNLPLTILEDVDKGVASLDLGPINAHGELVDAGILCPVGADHNVATEDFSLGLLEKEGIEVVLDEGISSAGSVRNSGKKNGFLRVPVGDL